MSDTTMQEVARRLADLMATYEFPGYIRVPLPVDGQHVDVGTNNPLWGANVSSADGQVGAVFDFGIPADSTDVDAIVAAIRAAVGRVQSYSVTVRRTVVVTEAWTVTSAVALDWEDVEASVLGGKTPTGVLATMVSDEQDDPRNDGDHTVEIIDDATGQELTGGDDDEDTADPDDDDFPDPDADEDTDDDDEEA